MHPAWLREAATLWLRPWRHGLDFSGRSGRVETIFFAATVFVGGLVCGAIGAYLLRRAGISSAPFSWRSGRVAVSGDPTYWLSLISLMVCFVPGLALGIRRCHDFGRSGWWLLPVIVPELVPELKWTEWVMLVVLVALPGRRSGNRYGDDPRDPLGPGEARTLRDIFR